MMREKLEQDRQLLEKQLFWIEVSCNECKKIGIKQHIDTKCLVYAK